MSVSYGGWRATRDGIKDLLASIGSIVPETTFGRELDSVEPKDFPIVGVAELCANMGLISSQDLPDLRKAGKDMSRR